jgi:hypothetical protein
MATPAVSRNLTACVCERRSPPMERSAIPSARGSFATWTAPPSRSTACRRCRMPTALSVRARLERHRSRHPAGIRPRRLSLFHPHDGDRGSRAMPGAIGRLSLPPLPAARHSSGTALPHGPRPRCGGCGDGGLHRIVPGGAPHVGKGGEAAAILRRAPGNVDQPLLRRGER